MAKPDSLRNSLSADAQSEITLIVTAARALGLDAPITAYRILGSRIELYTCHGGPFIYDRSHKRAWRKPARRARTSQKGE